MWKWPLSFAGSPAYRWSSMVHLHHAPIPRTGPGRTNLIQTNWPCNFIQVTKKLQLKFFALTDFRNVLKPKVTSSIQRQCLPNVLLLILLLFIPTRPVILWPNALFLLAGVMDFVSFGLDRVCLLFDFGLANFDYKHKITFLSFFFGLKTLIIFQN